MPQPRLTAHKKTARRERARRFVLRPGQLIGRAFTFSIPQNRDAEWSVIYGIRNRKKRLVLDRFRLTVCSRSAATGTLVMEVQFIGSNWVVLSST